MTHYSRPSKGRVRKDMLLSVRVYIFERDEFTCQYCGDEACEIDHIIPVSAGGSDHVMNLVAACRYCNGRVSNRVFDSLEEKKEYLALLSERRIKRKRRRLSICADCGIVFEYRKDGASRVLCADCYEIDALGEGDTYRERQARLRELNKGLISEESPEYRI